MNNFFAKLRMLLTMMLSCIYQQCIEWLNGEGCWYNLEMKYLSMIACSLLGISLVLHSVVNGFAKFDRKDKHQNGFFFPFLTRDIKQGFIIL